MHSFQPVDFEQMEVNPFKMIGKDWMLVTAGNEEKANTMTASWGWSDVGQECSICIYQGKPFYKRICR